MDFLYFFIDDLILHTQNKFAIELFLLVLQDFWDVKPAEVLSRINWILLLAHLFDNMVADVEKVASTFVSIASVSLSHYLLLFYHLGSVVVQHPPLLRNSIKNVRIVMAVGRKTIVNNHCV